MLFSALVTQIKGEARVLADDSFNAIVIGLLNELFKEATLSQRPFELRAETLIDVASITGLVTLPTDFFVYHQVLFNDVDTAREYPLINQDEASQPAPRGMYGHPKSFEVITGQLLIKPPAAIVGGDKVRLIYYKIPPTVTAETLETQNPIPRLEPFLIRAAIRRIRMLHTDDVQVAQMFSGDVTSAASAFTKDEPVRNPRPDPSRG